MPTAAYRVYNLMTNEELGRYDSEYAAAVAHKGEPVTIIYRPSKRKRK